MRYHRDDVVARAVALLDEVGLDGLSMRRLASELGVQPSALYHHFGNKAELLGAVADEILARGRRPTEVMTWADELRLVCVELRDIMLRHRDAAALVAQARALGSGGSEPVRRMTTALAWAGADAELARVGAHTLFHFVFGHVADEQVATEAGRPAPEAADFGVGLGLVLGGLEARVSRSQPVG